MRPHLLTLATVVAALPAVRAEDAGPGRSFLGNSAAVWAKELAEGGPPVRRAAAFALGKLGDTSGGALDHLTNALTDGEAAVRDAAAFALGEVAAAEHEEAVWDRAGELLRRSLGDGDGRVRRSAAFALGSCGVRARSATPALAAALEDPEATVRRNAAWALGRVVKGSRDPAAVAKLVAVLGRSAEDALVLRDVAGALREIGKPGAAAAVRPLATVYLSTRNPALRRAALTTLVGLVEPSLAAERPGSHRDLVRALLQALREGNAEQQALVAGALANLGDHAEPAVKDLAALAGGEDTPDEVRRNVVLALANAAGVRRRCPSWRRPSAPTPASWCVSAPSGPSSTSTTCAACAASRGPSSTS
jgi:HEAT repeat protein